MTERDYANMTMADLAALQDELQKLHEGEWEELVPQHARNKILWMVEELGEVISIIKKRGEKSIMQEPAVRHAFVEEMGDIMMLFLDTLSCYGISTEEFCRQFVEKHEYNMQRDYDKKNLNYLPGQKSELDR